MASVSAGGDLEAQAKTKVFLSYSRNDTAFVDRLQEALAARGFEPLVDRHDIMAFEDWWRRIQDLIAQADTVIFVLSPDAVASSVCRQEVEFAASLNKRFAPVVCRAADDKSIPAELRRFNFVFFDQPERFDEDVEKLATALATNIDWIRKHTEFGEQARRWIDAGRPRERLLGGALLEEAERWIATRPDQAPLPTEETQALVSESRIAARRRRRVLTATLSAGLLVALALAGMAYSQREAAVAQRRLAEASEARAVDQRDKALLTQSRFLASLANQRTSGQDAGAGLLLALEALEDVSDTVKRPYTSQAEVALFYGRQFLKEVAIVRSFSWSVGLLEFSGDGKRVITAVDDAAHVWDRETGETIALLKGFGHGFRHVTFSPDGTRALLVPSGGSPKPVPEELTAGIWDIRSGKQLISLKGHTDRVMSAAYSADGRHVVTVSWDTTARVWDAETGHPIAVLRGHTGRLSRAAFTADGRRVTTTSDDGTARVWSIESGAAIATIDLKIKPLTIVSAAFSPDGRRLVTATNDMIAQIRDADSGATTAVLKGHSDFIWCVTFSRDSQRVATASGDGTVRIWNATNGELIGRIVGHIGAVGCAPFTPEGDQLVTTSADGTVRSWRIDSGNPVVVNNSSHLIGNPAFSPDGQHVAVTMDTVQILDASSGRVLIVLPLPKGRESRATRAVFSHDGRRIVSVHMDDRVRIWDAATAQLLKEIPRYWAAPAGMTVHPDGRVVIFDQTAQAWDVETGEVVFTLKGHPGELRSVEFSRDGRRILTWSGDRAARVWDATTGQAIRALDHDFQIMSAAFSPDGRRVVSALGTMAIIWDAENGTQLGILKHERAVQNAAFSPDGRRIVTASDDKLARVWDADTRTVVAFLTGHTEGLQLVRFSPDGRRILTASSYDKTIRIWRVFPTLDALVSDAKNAVPRCLTRAQRAAAFLDEDPPAWCIEKSKWPYGTSDWQTWLRYKRANANPPRPDAPEWSGWLARQR